MKTTYLSPTFKSAIHYIYSIVHEPYFARKTNTLFSFMKCYCFLLFLLKLSNNANAQINGCTDPKANNYNAAATINDGTCTYNGANISPATTVTLNNELKETSGLIFWNNSLWSHNDDSNNKLYSLDASTGSILQSYPLNNTINKDWEEISQDYHYIYVGDFGNNSNGNRTDLHILRVEKSSLLSGAPLIDSIYFMYSNQTNFTATGANNTDFDCEAFLVTADSIYLFTKQWVSEKTSIYVLPKTPGSYTAQLRGTINIQGLVTGITYLESKRVAVMCGYSKTLQPFFYLLYDFKNNDFTKGNKRKVTANLAFHQIEGIATANGLKYYASNENFATLNIPQKLHTFDFTNYLGTYLAQLPTKIDNSKTLNKITVFPNPVADILQITLRENSLLGAVCHIYGIDGRDKMNFRLNDFINTIPVQQLPTGLYYLHIDGQAYGSSFIKN